MLDHHWAVPSKDRCSLSVDDEQQDSLNSDKVRNLILKVDFGNLVLRMIFVNYVWNFAGRSTEIQCHS